MRLLSILILFVALAVRADVFSVIEFPDVHADLGRTLQQFATNVAPWILTKTNDGDINAKVVVLHGDNYEAEATWVTSTTSTNGELYHGFQLTNDLRRLMTNGLLVAVYDGNHDNDNTNNVVGWSWPPQTGVNGTNLVTLFTTAFPLVWFTNQTGFQTNLGPVGDSKQLAYTYTNGNIKLLIGGFHMDPGTNDIPTTYATQSANLAALLNRFPDHNALIVCHQVLGTNMAPNYNDGTDGTYYDYCGLGPAIWQGGLLARPNILGVLSGHNRLAFKGRYVTNATDGHAVFASVFNTQAVAFTTGAEPKRNMDYLNILTFDTVKSTVRARTYCISEGRFYENGTATTSQFVSTYFPNGFEHTWEMPLPIRPQVQFLWRR